jgi:hypothetical protein
MTMAAMGAEAASAGQDNTLGEEAVRHLSDWRNSLPAHLSALHAKTNSLHCCIPGPQGAHIFALRLAAHVREAHGVTEEQGDLATASLLEIWIDDTEKHVWTASP